MMKINNQHKSYLNAVNQTKSGQTSKQTKTEEISKNQSPVQVNISKEAQALHDADKTVFSERVESIKTAIQNGDYEVDASKISSELVRTIQSQKEQ